MTTETLPLLGRMAITNEAYHAAPGIGKSALDLVARSPRHYWDRFVNPERVAPAPTPAMVIGTAVHAAVLEPDLFDRTYIAAPECDRRTTAGKQLYADFLAAAEGRTVLDADKWLLCQRLRDAVRSHPIAGGLLREGVAEASFFAEDRETGALVKCRPDWLPDSGVGVIDLKTCEDASPAGFARAAANFRYDVQAAWYLDVLEQAYGEAPEQFIFIAAEKTPPYAVGVYFLEVGSDALRVGREKARRDLDRILSCQQANAWPDYGHEPMALVLPAWAAAVEA